MEQVFLDVGLLSADIDTPRADKRRSWIPGESHLSAVGMILTLMEVKIQLHGGQSYRILCSELQCDMKYPTNQRGRLVGFTKKDNIDRGKGYEVMALVESYGAVNTLDGSLPLIIQVNWGDIHFLSEVSEAVDRCRQLYEDLSRNFEGVG